MGGPAAVRATGAGRCRPICQTGRSPVRRRRAHVEPVARTSSGVRRRASVRSRPSVRVHGRHPLHVLRAERAASDGGAVPVDDREHDLQAPVRRDETRDSRRDRCVQAERAAEQRAPRESDRDAVGEAVESRRHVLDAGGDEHDVGVAAARRASRGAPGSLGHRPRIGVDGQDEGVPVRGGLGERRPAVTGADVDDDPPMPAGEVEDLADVRLVRAAADDRAHGPIVPHGAPACPPRNDRLSRSCRPRRPPARRAARRRGRRCRGATGRGSR